MSNQCVELQNAGFPVEMQKSGTASIVETVPLFYKLHNLKYAPVIFELGIKDDRNANNGTDNYDIIAM